MKDVETFEKIKPDDMTIINSLKETEEEGSRFIIGYVCMNERNYKEDSVKE